MSMYEALYGRPGHGVDPQEPEKKGLARFAQMVGRDLGQLLGTNLLACVLLLPAALGVSLGVVLLSLPLTLGLGALTGLLAGPAVLLVADCCLRSLQNDPAPWLPRARQTLAAHWKGACGFGAAGMTVLGALCFVCAFVFEAADQQGYYPGIGVLAFLALDLLVFAAAAGLCAAQLPLPRRQGLARGTAALLLARPGRCVAGGVVLLAGVGGMILLFPVSVFWAVLFGFWLPGLAAMQLYFPALREQYGLTVRQIPRPVPAPRPQTEREQRRARRANWWYYNWGIVAVLGVVALGVVYAVHGLTTIVDPDCRVAVVTAQALPDEAVERLEETLAPYAQDWNRDGVTVVEVNNYTWSAQARQTEMNSQMAGAARMNADLANGETRLWVLEDAEGFEAAFGVLSEKLGPDWRQQLLPWSEQPALAALPLGSYATAADGSQRQDVQQRLAACQVALLGPDPLWDSLAP